MTERDALIATWRKWRRYCVCPEGWESDCCPLCEYADEKGRATDRLCDFCPIWKWRRKECGQYVAFNRFRRAALCGCWNEARKHARRIVRILEGIIVSAGYEAPKS